MALDKITTDIIADDAVTAAKIVAGAVEADIRADAIGTAEIANDVTISTSGNIATTGSGTLTVAGTSTLTGNATASGNLTVTGDIVPSTPLSHRNHVINGDFQVAQRGTSFTSTDGGNNYDKYTLDRWYISSQGNDIIDVTQSSTAPTNQLYSIALDIETANKNFGIYQIIENKNCVGLIGNTVTLSFKAKVSNTRIDSVKAGIVAWSGSADAVTSDIINAWNGDGVTPTLINNATFENTPTNLNVTTSWATYSVTATIDTANTTNVLVGIFSDDLDTTVGDILYITDVQLEQGSNATPFERRGYEEELARCQRYFYQLTSDDSSQFVGLGGFYNATQLEVPVTFPTTMRTNPTFSSASVTNGYSARNEDTGNDQFDGWTGVAGVNKSCVMIYTTSGMNGSASTGQTARVYTNSASSSIAFSAEL